MMRFKDGDRVFSRMNGREGAAILSRPAAGSTITANHAPPVPATLISVTPTVTPEEFAYITNLLGAAYNAGDMYWRFADFAEENGINLGAVPHD